MEDDEVDQQAGTGPPQAAPPAREAGSWLARLLAEPSVRITVIAWLAANVAVVLIARGHLPFHRPGLHGAPFVTQVLAPNVAIVEVLALMAVVFALTRRRVVPDLAARAPQRAAALQETLSLVGYGIGGLVGGFVLGTALGFHPISFHLTGTLYGTDEPVTPLEVGVWAAYNFAVFAVAPYLYFRRRYSATQLNLKSTDLRNDVLVIVVVLLIECVVELLGLSSAIFDLSVRQLALGAPLSFAVYFVGTVLPTMIFVQCVLVPRYRRLTGSTATTVILGGVTYTLLHCFDGWQVFTTPGAVALSVIFLFLQYLGPGMIKTVLTLRTGNAWVHVWAYHAIAPHTIADTPLIVKIFRLG
ncbi:MAG TPA: hypothetical protein VG276_30030 [Actinomycetes bacterium]|jgi:hypothetical protein|nr:hypothetical protein [Actinomycetes bacterium]